MKLLRALLLSLLSVPFVACAGRSARESRPVEVAPAPYTADEIRAAHPPGTKIVFLVEQAGLPAIHRTMIFGRADDDGTTLIEGHTTTPEGQEVAPVEEGSATWEELQQHAAFPADLTERAEAEVTVPAGRFACALYTVTTVEDEVPTVSRYWFAHEKPGPPVLLEVQHGGVLVLRMTLLEYHKG